jgi:hypothetical protein
LALTSPTSGGRSIGIVRWRTKAPEVLFSLAIVHRYNHSFSSPNNLTAGNLLFSFSLKVGTHHAPADLEIGDKFVGMSTVRTG